MKGNAFHVASEIESVAAYRRVHQKLCFCVAFELVRAMRQARMVKKAQLESGIEKDEGNRPRKNSIVQEKYFLLCSCFACQILSCEILNIKNEDCTMGPRSLVEDEKNHETYQKEIAISRKSRKVRKIKAVNKTEEPWQNERSVQCPLCKCIVMNYQMF